MKLSAIAAMCLGLIASAHGASDCNVACQGMLQKNSDAFKANKKSAQVACNLRLKAGIKMGSICRQAFDRTAYDACNVACQTQQTGNSVKNHKEMNKHRKSCHSYKNKMPYPQLHDACVDGINKGTLHFAKKGRELRKSFDAPAAMEAVDVVKKSEKRKARAPVENVAAKQVRDAENQKRLLKKKELKEHNQNSIHDKFDALVHNSIDKIMHNTHLLDSWKESSEKTSFRKQD